MLLFSVMHEYCFSYKEFMPGGVGIKDLKAMGYEEGELVNIRSDTSWRSALSRIPDVCDLNDVWSDMKQQFSSSAGQHIMLGIEGGIISEGDVNAVQAREEASTKIKLAALSLFKTKVRAEVSDKTATGADAGTGTGVGMGPATPAEKYDGKSAGGAEAPAAAAAPPPPAACCCCHRRLPSHSSSRPRAKACPDV